MSITLYAGFGAGVVAAGLATPGALVTWPNGVLSPVAEPVSCCAGGSAGLVPRLVAPLPQRLACVAAAAAIARARAASVCLCAHARCRHGGSNRTTTLNRNCRQRKA